MTYIALAAVAVCIALVLWTLRQLRLSGGISCPGPFWEPLYFEIPVMILPSLLAIYAFGLKSTFLLVRVTDAQLAQASAWLVYGLVVFCISLVTFDRLFGKFKFGSVRDNDDIVAFILIICVIGLLSIIYMLAGYLPLFYLGASNVNILRKSVTTNAAFSSYYGVALSYLSYLGMAYAGSISARNRRTLRLVLVVSCCVGLLWTGSKGPVLNGLLTYYFSYLWFHNKRVSIRRIVFIVVVGSAGLWIMYLLTNPSLSQSALLARLATRLFLNQMSGYYQAYAISTPDAHYMVNWIPLGGLFGVKTTVFSQNLMVQIYGNTDTSGTLNSVFLQDAWGTLGYLGLIISPIIVGASMILSLHVLTGGLRRVAGPRFSMACVFAFLDTNVITGSFANFVLLRGAIIALVLSFAVALVCKIIAVGQYSSVPSV